MRNGKKIALWLGPLLFFIFLFFPHPNVDDASWNVLAVALWMLVWWLSETVHLAVTALLPLLLFPLLGIMDIKSVAPNYANPMVYLFFGGFVLALAIEKWNLHKRIALYIILLTGTGTLRIFLGFMLATAFLSMWISNTATTVMMLPIALSVVGIMAPKKDAKIPILLLIALAWSANVGGMATLIGTPPNLVMAGFMREELNCEIFFSEWLKYGLPVSIILLFAAFLLLRFFIPEKERTAPSADAHNMVKSELAKLGKLKGPELRTLYVFAATAFAWIFRKQIVQITGLDALSDTIIALLAAIILFVFPSGKGKNERLLQWRDTEKLGWGILILFGGGLALAAGIQQSIWVDEIGNAVSKMGISGIFGLIILMALIGVFLTEIVSNLALVTALMPLVAAIAGGANADFFQLALPLTLGASCAFMLPMATPPNAIVFSSGRITVLQMARYGFVMNLVAVAIIVLISWALL